MPLKSLRFWRRGQQDGGQVYIPDPRVAVLEFEIDWLRSLVERLTQHQIVLERKSVGLPERVAEARKWEPAPSDLVLLCAKFETHGKSLLRAAEQRHNKDGVAYESIADELKRSIIDSVGPQWLEVPSQPAP